MKQMWGYRCLKKDQFYKNVSDHAHYWSVVFLCVILYAYPSWIFRSSTSLQAFIQQFGKYAVMIFVLLQVIQVIIPILPGGDLSVAGMLMFGNGFGLLYSCIGLVIGEAIGFLLVRYYGVALSSYFIAKKSIRNLMNCCQENERYQKSTSRYLAASFAARRLDLSSSWFDEIIFREFMQIVIFLKPWSVGVYSMIMLFLFIKRKVIYNVKKDVGVWKK